jgi:hypothetical protein
MPLPSVTLDIADEQTFLQAWRTDAAFMKQQPGFISTQLHRAIGESSTYLNYAVWESTADFRAAFTHPESRAKLYPLSVLGRGFTAPVPEGRGARRVPRVATGLASSTEEGSANGKSRMVNAGVVGRARPKEISLCVRERVLAGIPST